MGLCFLSNQTDGMLTRMTNCCMLLALLVPGCFSANPSLGCGKPLPSIPRPGHSHNNPIEVVDPLLGPVSRAYRLHLPAHWPMTNNIPLPLLVDYPGWTENMIGHERDSMFYAVADEDEEGGFLLVTPKGMGDVGEEKGWGSFNISKTQGPLGNVCDTNRQHWGEITCYDSCQFCDPFNSCDFSSCYDDTVFTETLLDKIVSEYCIDLDSIHQTGRSNGGMFSYHIAAHMDRFASIGPVAGSPFLGYAEVPDRPLSVIDFHGTADQTIPYSLTTSEGSGPDDTVISFDGYFYYDKPRVITSWAEGLDCGPALPWPTQMDGVQGFTCFSHSGCRGGGEVVHCNAEYGHDYPFGPDRYIEGSRIMWSFMKTHPRDQAGVSEKTAPVFN